MREGEAPVTVDCTLVLRHETGRAPDTEYPSLTRIAYVESSRVVRRPAHGTATETLECDECGRPVAFTVFSRRRTRGWRTAWWVLLLTLIIVPLVTAVMFASMFFVSAPGFTAYVPGWIFGVLVGASLLFLGLLPYCLFHLTDEFGVRSVIRWRFTEQTVVSDARKGAFVAKCPSG
jgi:hypothetical protein